MLGRNLGNYGVVSKIGEGGMGVVYLAQHVTLGRKAAIKVLRPALSSNQDVVSRFFNEARAVTAVRNPGIVDVYDFGFLEDRTAYIIMEYLDGESLAARLRRGRATIPWTLTVVRAMTRALQAAHEQSIVHRDLKPDNVFLVPDADLPGGERVKLLDFGIAKLAHGVGDASQTTTGTVMGTPTYMSPEQCRGAGSVDHRADLYSLGCVAYEMLCGQPPFVADGPGDVIARHLYFEPPSLRSRRSDIPPELEELVLKLLKKEPRARFSTAADLVRAIDQLSVARLPAAAPSKPLATEFVATLPVMKDTTLNGAASSRVSVDKGDRSRRLHIVSVAVTVAIAAFVLVWFFARGSHDAESGATIAAALPTGSRAPSEVAAPAPHPPPAVPAPAAPALAAPAPVAPVPAVPPPDSCAIEHRARLRGSAGFARDQRPGPPARGSARGANPPPEKAGEPALRRRPSHADAKRRRPRRNPNGRGRGSASSATHTDRSCRVRQGRRPRTESRAQRRRTTTRSDAESQPTRIRRRRRAKAEPSSPGPVDPAPPRTSSPSPGAGPQEHPKAPDEPAEHSSSNDSACNAARSSRCWEHRMRPNRISRSALRKLVGNARHP